MKPIRLKFSSAVTAVVIALAPMVGLIALSSHAQLRDERLTRQLLEGLPTERSAAPRTIGTPNQAARSAQRQYGGEVLAVETLRDNYRVKLLVNGEVKIVTVGD